VSCVIFFLLLSPECSFFLLLLQDSFALKDQCIYIHIGLYTLTYLIKETLILNLLLLDVDKNEWCTFFPGHYGYFVTLRANMVTPINLHISHNYIRSTH
jgi:hypothetical protein